MATQQRTRPDMCEVLGSGERLLQGNLNLSGLFKGKSINTPEHMFSGQGKTNPPVNVTEAK